MAKSKGLQIIKLEDPIKTAVSNPLSSYLSTQIGKGLPRYTEATGKALYEPIDTSAYSKFMSIDPGEWYTKAIQEPTLKAAREEVPFIEEGWAGSLRGSGRFRDVEDYWSDVSETLGQGRYQAELEIPQAQFQMAGRYAEARTRQIAAEYADWVQSLPENNPTLSQAIQFLQSDTGINYVTYQNPAKKSNTGALIGTLAGAAILGVLTGGLGFGAAAGGLFGAGGLIGGGTLGAIATGAVAGGAAGSMFDR